MPGGKESDVAVEENRGRGEREVRERWKEGRRRGGQDGGEREMKWRSRWQPEEGGEKNEIEDEERKGGGEGRKEGEEGVFQSAPWDGAGPIGLWKTLQAQHLRLML